MVSLHSIAMCVCVCVVDMYENVFTPAIFWPEKSKRKLNEFDEFLFDSGYALCAFAFLIVNFFSARVRLGCTTYDLRVQQKSLDVDDNRVVPRTWFLITTFN